MIDIGSIIKEQNRRNEEYMKIECMKARKDGWNNIAFINLKQDIEEENGVYSIKTKLISFPFNDEYQINYILKTVKNANIIYKIDLTDNKVLELITKAG